MRRDWYVLHVKPRTEKKVALYLSRYGFFCHLPLLEKVAKVQRRKVRRELPLFPGYVFTRLLPEERLKMLRTNLLVRTIPVPRPREMIHQLRQIRRATKVAGPEMRVLARTFKAGDRVLVTAGPMRGTEGHVKYDGDRAIICLNVDILGTSVEMNISPSDIEKMPQAGKPPD